MEETGGGAEGSGEAVDLGWHVVPGCLFLDYLRRAHGGDDPDLLFAELWANADHETFRQESDD